ncbi:MAG TPA: PLP-dependent aminotransferase family protein [Geothrix sp.]|nr:PLP-dependent aminotransferase family protein [Geothrix sp.]
MAPTLFLDPQGREPIYLQIAHALMRQIHRGALKPGDSLPGYRVLGAQLGVGRNTVMAAYHELQAEGWVVSTQGEGSVVAAQPPTRLPGGAPETDVPDASKAMGFDLSPGEDPAVAQSASGLLKVASGLPDPRLLPGAELARAYRRALVLNRQQNLMLEDPQGHPMLRESLARMLRSSRGIPATSENILVTRGSQMALFLVGQALLTQGAAVAVEALGHPGAWEAFTRAGARCLPVPLDEEGLRVAALEQLAHSERLRAVFVTPLRQYPTLVQLSVERRERLMALAAAHRFAVIENDQDSEFLFEGRARAPLAAEDPAGVVIHVGTLSKIFSPNVRLGFVHGPAPLIARMRALRQALDRQGDMVLERAFAELLDDGAVHRHLNRMQQIYRTRRDVLCRALAKALGETLSFQVPEGGLALWAKVKEGVDVDRWAARALEHGVAFQPGRRFAFDGGPVQALRLGFSNYPEADLEEVAIRMRDALGDGP